MLDSFELYSVDSDAEASIRNVYAEWHSILAAAIRKAVLEFEGMPVPDPVIVERGRLIHFEGSDIVHFSYLEHLLLAWTKPKLESAGVTRVHMHYSIGKLEPASEDTLNTIDET